MSKLTSKRFVVRKSLVGKNQTIEVTFKNGNSVTYNHDKVYEIMKENLEKLPCFEKYGSYTASNNIPKVLRDKKLV
tara:strand:- start:643 stop:870 length:228 start_codon:yes stop_codon:yes gene_type:complete